MNEPILVVMAAGIGSRYGGLKQTDPVGLNGELIIDYSVYDAIKAGFTKAIFIINRKIENEFKEVIGTRLKDFIHVEYAYQELTDLPKDILIPTNRKKPWGTAHAIYSARNLIDAPFAVINADDYYGLDAFQKMYDFLRSETLKEHDYSMVGYQLKNTVTKHGYVSRGICTVENNILVDVIERIHIEQKSDDIMYLENEHWYKLKENTIVSMNMWGFTETILKEIDKLLPMYLETAIIDNPLKCEFFLPYVVNQVIKNNIGTVNMLHTDEKWYGVTYSEDKKKVVDAISALIDNGKYPLKLWGGSQMNELTTLKKICEEFKFEGVLTECSPYGEGHINDTFLTVCVDKYEEKRRYILQRVNHLIFKETEQLMSNIENITFYLSDMVREAEIEEGFEVLKLIKTKNDSSFYKDAEGNYWRSYAFIENATGHTFAKDNDMLYSAGKAVGQFQLMLKDYPVDSLYETIKGFHHTENRYKSFLEVLEKDVHSRSKYCLDDIQFVKDHKAITTMILEALEQGEIPYRVTHNDTKLNNVLIDNESGIGRCVIDLDTVMPGSALYDFGDAIRSCGSTVAEDEENLELLKFDTDRFDAYSKGFLEVLNHELTKKEIELLPYSAIIMTLECGMRFLTDFLDGDNYFKVQKENHNLIRAKNQFRFIEEMENNLEEMKAIVNRYC